MSKMTAPCAPRPRAAGARPEPAPFDVVRAVDLQRVAPEQRWLVESLWAHEGVGFVGGTPKSLKSWVSLDLAVAVATNTPCLAHYQVRQAGPGLVYLAEDRIDVVRERLEALSAARGIGFEALSIDVITTPSVRLDLPEHCRRLAATIDKYQPRLLVLDPFVRLHKGDENNSQDIAAILGELRELQRRFNLAIVVVHHTTKNPRARQLGQALRGSGDFHAWSDSALYLNHTQAGLQLSIEHRAAPAPEPCYVRLADDPPHPLLAKPTDDDASPSLHDRILETLRRHEQPVTRTELRRLLAVQNSRLGTALKALAALGRIQHTDQGWSL